MGTKPPVDELFNPQIFGTPKYAQSNQSFPQSAGKGTIAQNSNGVTILCSNVKSDSLIYTSIMDNTRQSSGNLTALAVSSIVPGTSFNVVTNDSSPIAASGGMDFAWHIFDVQ